MTTKEAYIQAFWQAAADRGLTKAGQMYPQQSLGVQGHMPLGSRRELSSEEEEGVRKGKKQIIPRIFKSHKTPIPEMMASPGKGALLAGLLMGGAGATYGGAMGSLMGGGSKVGLTTGALVGGIPLGLLGALIAYKTRARKNETLQDLMERMPEGYSGTYRDYLSDPTIQSELNRAAMLSAGYAAGR